MSQYRETCHCSHDKASHAYVGSVRVGDCLCMGCECKGYVNEFEPKPAAKPKRPNHPSWCQCFDCKEYAKSIPMPRINTPVPPADHDTWPP